MFNGNLIYHILAFTLNIVSIQKLINHSNIQCLFSHDVCQIQDTHTLEIIEHVILVEVLYHIVEDDLCRVNNMTSFRICNIDT